MPIFQGDVFEVVALLTAFLGACCSIWAGWRTYQKMGIIKRLGANGDLKAKAQQRLTRHVLNFIVQLILMYMAAVAAYYAPFSETYQTLTSRICQTMVSLILATKVLLDRWYELNVEWDGLSDRRRHDDQP